jgi:hypothetical protein
MRVGFRLDMIATELGLGLDISTALAATEYSTSDLSPGLILTCLQCLLMRTLLSAGPLQHRKVDSQRTQYRILQALSPCRIPFSLASQSLPGSSTNAPFLANIDHPAR